MFKSKQNGRRRALPSYMKEPSTTALNAAPTSAKSFEQGLKRGNSSDMNDRS
nr:hypothetical protein [Bacillus subtilis]MDH3147029.1 hypothetical protein [Bacillus subtilis]